MMEKRPYDNQFNHYCEKCKGWKLHTRGPKYYTCLTCGTKEAREIQNSKSQIQKRELITISFVGNKKFKQFLVNKINDLLNSEDVFEEVAKPGCGFTFESSIEPEEE